jgi:probable rRNA maturation factor
VQFPDLFFEEETPLHPVNLYAEDVDIPDGLPDEAALSVWLAQMAEREGKRLLEASYIFCSDEHLLQVNIDYLQHDYYTDIITFQNTDNVIHGDMYISVDRVKDNATQIGVPFLNELLRVMAHGALHLAGYGDKTSADATLMRTKEDEYVGMLIAPATE